MLLLALAAGTWLALTRHPAKVRELTIFDLDRRDGVLFASGEKEPFNGHLIENYTATARKATVEVHNGKVHGVSCGWYDNGQIEVEETFVEGVSHGTRTRWHANGARKSLAQIEHGEVVGPYFEWYDNGQRAVQMTLRDGQPDGLVEAWHRSGALKSHVRFEQGKQVSREFWPDPVAATASNSEKSG